MKAIYKGQVHQIVEDTGSGLILDHDDEPGWISVDFGERSLIVDPTDAQIDAANAGRPIPPDPSDTITVYDPAGNEAFRTDSLRPWEAKALLDAGATITRTFPK